MNTYQQTSQGGTEETQFGLIHHNLSDLMPTSSEIAHLWISFLAENQSICILKKWVNQSKDPEIHPFLQQVLDTSSKREEMMKNLFNSINHPIPSGFDDNDVNINGPTLFSETFACLYTRMMQKMILHNYVSAITSCYRTDFRDFFSDCLKTSDELHRKATEILLAKGILQKHPCIVTPSTIKNVQSKDYMGSYLRFFGVERPLNAMEISHIYTLMEVKQLIKIFNSGVSQVVRSKKIRNFAIKSTEIADKQLEVLGHLLTDEDIPRPSLSEILITDTKEPSFSDRLILSHSTAVASYITTVYGLAIPCISRKDIVTTMMKLATEVLGLTKDGAELLVEAGCFERMPETADRKKLKH